MNEKYLIKHSEEAKNILSKTSSTRARRFLYEHGYSSSSFTMPDYYKASGFDKMKLQKINNWKKVPITQTLDIFTPKGDLSWRRFSFIHPYMYWHIVDVLTEEENWEKLRNHLCNPTLVASYSNPEFTIKPGENVQGKRIKNWLQMAERDLLKDCGSYNCLAITDIQNFYSSIYTHSIAWALHSKREAREDARKRELFGNKLDKLFQNSRDTQTNGIPTGSMVSDIIAEIVLTKIDIKISQWIEKEKLDSYIIVTRFCDDYRILCKNISFAHKFFNKLNRILHENFDLILNPSKTHIYEDVLEKAFRPWDQEINQSHLIREIRHGKLPKKISFYFFRDVLLETYRIQKKYSKGRPSITILSKLAEKLNNKELIMSSSNIIELIAILRKIVFIREEVTPYSILLIDTLLEKYNVKQKEQFINEMIKEIKERHDSDYQLIWLYRLCLSKAPDLCEKISKSLTHIPPLINIVHNNEEFQKQRKYCEIFPSIRGDVSSNDIEELKKFSFIASRNLKRAESKKITSSSISPFKYKGVT